VALGHCSKENDRGIGIMSVSVSVTGTFTSPRFKGTKDIDPILRKKNMDLTDEEIWEKILGGDYQQPYCPVCHSRMEVSSFSLEYQVTPPYSIGQIKTYFYSGFSWHTRMASPAIHVEMLCPICGITLKAVGTGLNLEGDFYSLETLSVIENKKS